MPFAAIACLAAAVAVVGCKAIIVRDQPPPQPVVVVQQGPPPGPIVVSQAPPPMVVEQIPPPPDAYVVWVPGYQHWERDHWVLVRGHYDRPPHPGAVWVQPHYEHAEHGVQYHPGYWRER